MVLVLTHCSSSSRDTGDILLKICNLMPQDTGIYTCVAVNDHGSASSSASIKVQGRRSLGPEHRSNGDQQKVPDTQ